MTLSELKLRLEALPARQEIANQGQLFSGFCEKASKARLKANDAVTAARYAKSAIAAFDDKEVFARAKQAGRRAARLHKKLSRDPAAVGESSVGTSFASLTSEADAAYTRCTTSWSALLASKLAGRAALAEVLAKVLPSVGTEMRQTVSDLERASQQLPLTEAAALRVIELLRQFDDTMNKIRLSDEVGEFLQKVAGSTGATLKSLENPKVQAFLNEHNLLAFFRIRLQ